MAQSRIWGKLRPEFSDAGLVLKCCWIDPLDRKGRNVGGVSEGEALSLLKHLSHLIAEWLLTAAVCAHCMFTCLLPMK